MMRQRISNQHISVQLAMRRLFSTALATALVVVSGVVAITAGQQSARRSSSATQLGQQPASNEAALTMFRAGRDLITEEQWDKAQEKFSQFIAAYPNDKSVDAAMYWMAY